MKPKVSEVPASDVSFSHSIYQLQAASATQPDIDDQRRLAEIQRLDQNKILSRPFRHFKYFIGSPMKQFQQALSMDRFSHVKIAGMNGAMKLDPQGWAHDGGRTLDRIVGR